MSSVLPQIIKDFATGSSTVHKVLAYSVLLLQYLNYAGLYSWVQGIC